MSARSSGFSRASALRRSMSPARDARSGRHGRIDSYRDLEHTTSSPAARELASLVDGDRDEPRPKAFGFADRVQLSPGDRPSRLDGFLGELGIAAGDDKADARHVRMVGVDDPGEGDLVAVHGTAHQRCRCLAWAARQTDHRRIDARRARSDSLASVTSPRTRGSALVPASFDTCWTRVGNRQDPVEGRDEWIAAAKRSWLRGQGGGRPPPRPVALDREAHPANARSKVRATTTAQLVSNSCPAPPGARVPAPHPSACHQLLADVWHQ